MKHREHANLWTYATLVLGAIALLGPTVSRAADPQLQQAIARGSELFQHNTFSGRGRVCETCHLGGGAREGRRPDGVPIPSLSNAATIFPRISQDDNRLITLADQVRICIGGALNGKAPDYGSDELNALVAYVTSLAQGKPIDMGGEPK
jgi:thiosulfate dehydrogenase